MTQQEVLPPRFFFGRFARAATAGFEPTLLAARQLVEAPSAGSTPFPRAPHTRAQ